MLTLQLLVLVAAVLLGPGSVHALSAQTFTVSHNQTSFQVFLNDLLVIDHQTDSPAIFLGDGTTTYRETQGSFIINDTTTEILPLTEFSVEDRDVGSQRISVWSQGNNDSIVDITIFVSEDGIVTIQGGIRHEDPSTYNRLWIRFHAEKEESVFGGGEQYTFLNLRGRNYPIWTREQGIIRDPNNPLTWIISLYGGAGGNYDTTYWPQPSFLSSRGYYLLSETDELNGLNFTAAEYHEFYTQNCALFSFRLAAGSPLELVQWTNTGRQLVPDWALTGVILGVQGGTEIMLQRYHQAKDAGVKVAGMWIQDWAGRKDTTFGQRLFWNWRWNETLYPGLDEAIKNLDAEGVKVLAYINPHLNIEGDIYLNNTGKGYFLTNSDGEDYVVDFGEFFCVTVDLLSDAAADWYQNLIQTNLLDLGIAGWMADFGEYTPVDAVSSNITALTSPAALHNAYPSLWGRVNRRAVIAADKEQDTLFFVRAGGSRQAQHVSMSWSGDQDVDWTTTDGFATTVVSALSLAVSGCGMNHYDIGGYTTQAPFFQRSEELLVRSAEAAVFTPVMRTHEGSRPASNTQWYTSESTLAAFARLSQLFVTLAPYTREAIDEYNSEHTPLQRPLFLHYPEVLTPYSEENTGHVYLYGRDLLVAPVYRKGVTQWSVALPHDQWRHLWTGEVFTGPVQAQVDAPLGQPAVFYRASSKWVELFQKMGNMTVKV